MLTLARRLGNEGRSILVRLDDADGGADALALGGEPGVRDLIAASASFSEAIRRDPRSRLHVIPAGPRAASDEVPAEPGPIEAAELSGVLDALARTYDFIWLLAPALDASDMAPRPRGRRGFLRARRAAAAAGRRHCAGRSRAARGRRARRPRHRGGAAGPRAPRPRRGVALKNQGVASSGSAASAAGSRRGRGSHRR